MKLARAVLNSVCTAAILAGCTGPASAPRQTGLEANRQLVLAFYQEGLTGKQPRSAFERYMTADFIEHKPDVNAGTREETITFLEELIKSMPDPRWEVVRTIAENDLVFVHARFTPAAGAPPYAIADVLSPAGWSNRGTLGRRQRSSGTVPQSEPQILTAAS